MTKELTDLVNAHWEYVESVIRTDFSSFEQSELNGFKIDTYIAVVGHHLKEVIKVKQDDPVCTCGWERTIGRINDPGCPLHRTWNPE